MAMIGMCPPLASTPGASASTSGVAQALKALGQDLQSGNLSGAQQDFSAIQQAVQRQESPGGGHGHHRHHHAAGPQQSGSDPISQAFGALGQALQAGNLTSAQTAYASIQQDLQGSLPQRVYGLRHWRLAVVHILRLDQRLGVRVTTQTFQYDPSCGRAASSSPR